MHGPKGSFCKEAARSLESHPIQHQASLHSAPTPLSLSLPQSLPELLLPEPAHQDPTTTVHSPQVTHNDGASKMLPLTHSAWKPPSEPLNSASNPGCCQLQGYGRVALEVSVGWGRDRVDAALPDPACS